jgi:MoaA/NifB/PqqE/SkfB family radical SAM enzyme
MLSIIEQIKFAGSILKNLRIVKAGPAILKFLTGYMNKFKIQYAGGNFIIHSHLPPVNSKAYSRFIDEHLIGGSKGPSHAQIGITNACPQKCEYCYNKNRTGIPLDTGEIIKAIGDLKKLGVFWLGLTGGEPLLNKDIVEIIRSASDGCAVKLFTTGCGLTEKLAEDMKKAGLYSVCVSLDSSKAEEHDKGRNYEGAYSTALKAVEIFRKAGVHTGVSAVLSKEMINRNDIETFLSFLDGLHIHEAWLSEAKPSVESYWKSDMVVTPAEKGLLKSIQEERNKKPGMTVNYLGHFESGEHFGCNAGNKMIYIDAFGETSPCVFIPMTFGNIKEVPVGKIWEEMRRNFPSENKCFIDSNYGILKKHYKGKMPLSRAESLEMLKEVSFGALSVFNKLLKKKHAGNPAWKESI